MENEIINRNLEKLTRLEKLIGLSKGKPEFEALRQKYEAIYGATSALMNMGADDRLASLTAPGDLPRETRWGIPISPGWDPADPVFRRHPKECACFLNGVLNCGVPCVWAWPPGARRGSKAMRLKR